MLQQSLSSLQEQDSFRKTLKEDFSNSCNKSHEDGFVTPCFKAAPNAFVAKRSNYSMPHEFSPLPEAFSNLADEDTWLKLNKGYVADLDSLQRTPARKVQSFPFSDITPVSAFPVQLNFLYITPRSLSMLVYSNKK